MVMASTRGTAWLWLLLTIAALVGGCTERAPRVESGRDTLLEPPLSNQNILLLAATRVALPPSGVVPRELPDPGSPGAQAVEQYCTACHALPSPLIHSATDWPGVVRRMWLRTDRVASVFAVPRPTTGERITILQYLLDNSLKVSAGALPAGPGRDLFTGTCSRCHALPDPTQHSPEDWVAVVRRMTERMQQMLGERPKRDDFQRIVLYLESVSRAAS